MVLETPATRPGNPRFSSGPCAKPPVFELNKLADAPLGRSHRAAVGKAKLKAAIEGTREVLGIPADYKIGIVPASDTGAVEMAMWNLLGARPVEMLAWESFGSGWVTDVVKQLKLDAEVKTADYGEIVDLETVNTDRDVVFTWNGTTSGVRVPNGNWIKADRQGLTICDATSAAFAQDLPWDKLDVVTFSWQKVLGGEAAHGMLILSPRAVERLESYTPDWPLPKIFRLTKGGKLIDGVFEGATINTPSMLAVEDYLLALDWARSVGGLKGLIARADANAAAVADFVSITPWIENLAVDPATQSNTSVCVKFNDSRITDGAAFAKAVAKRLETEGVAYDVGAYRDAPPGLRIWCGGTVEASDIEALMPWIKWAFELEVPKVELPDGMEPVQPDEETLSRLAEIIGQIETAFENNHSTDDLMSLHNSIADRDDIPAEKYRKLYSVMSPEEAAKEALMPIPRVVPGIAKSTLEEIARRLLTAECPEADSYYVELFEMNTRSGSSDLFFGYNKEWLEEIGTNRPTPAQIVERAMRDTAIRL